MFQFGLVAAHLEPKNTQEWLRLAEMSMEAGNLKECAKCYWQGEWGLKRLRNPRSDLVCRN